MTVPPAPPPPQQTSTQQASTAAETALVIAVASALLLSATVAIAMASLAVLLKGFRVRAQSMEASLTIVMGHPPGQDGFYGPAGHAMARLNLLRRAQFAVMAARRIDLALTRAHSRGESMPQALAGAVQLERRYYAQHLMAIWGRQKAGAQVDSAAMTYGRLIGWHTVRDKKTSAECLAADGKNFYADHMPVIGYPGTVHPHCRCLPGAPFPRGAILPSYGLKLRRAA